VKANQLTWIAPSVLLCLIGVALLWVSTHSTGDLADAGVLVGATLTSLTLFPVSVAIDHRLRTKKLREHLTRYETASKLEER
jgi:hypothetical protein